jgi:hypothetical protein
MLVVPHTLEGSRGFEAHSSLGVGVLVSRSVSVARELNRGGAARRGYVAILRCRGSELAALNIYRRLVSSRLVI